MIIFGFRTTTKVLLMLSYVCRMCGTEAAHPLREHRTKFTLFFIPLFTTSLRYEWQCTRCGVTTLMPKDDAKKLLDSPPAGNQA